MCRTARIDQAGENFRSLEHVRGVMGVETPRVFARGRISIIIELNADLMMSIQDEPL